MKVFIQCDKNGLPLDYDFFNAYAGFKEMGFETVFFHDYEQLKVSEKNDVIVAFFGPVKTRLHDFGIEVPNIDYPKSISKYFGRKIWKSTIDTINSNPELWNVFVKPINNKTFNGRIVRQAKDLIGCGMCGLDQEVYVSEIVNFVSEYRVFVRYGKVLDVRQYKGDWRVYPDYKVIESCINDFTDSPKAYAIDFGVTDNGKTLVVEVNASCSIGSYGLDVIKYAKFRTARWAELTNTEDECAFDL